MITALLISSPFWLLALFTSSFKDQRRDRFRSVFLPLEFERVFLTHVTLNQGARIVRVADLRLLGLAADINSSVVVEVHNRGGSVVAYEVFDDFWNAKFVTRATAE